MSHRGVKKALCNATADLDGWRQSNRDSSAAATGTGEADGDDMKMPEATRMTQDGGIVRAEEGGYSEQNRAIRSPS